MTRDRYFVALLPPQELQTEMQQIQQHFATTYQLRRKANSPPHITMYPPFEWQKEDVPLLVTTLREFAQDRGAIPIQLAGFSAFKPRVIFIEPLKTPELMQAQASLKQQIESHLDLGEQKERNRPFNPHVTIAFCDRRNPDFKHIWPEVKNREFNTTFTVDRLTLLIYKNRYWHLYQEFNLVNG
jgi:2'-5' RNA ligase